MPPKAKSKTQRAPAQMYLNHTNSDLYTVSTNATPHERLTAFLFNRINTPRFLNSLAISKSGKRRPDPFMSPANLPENQRAIFNNLPNDPLNSYREEFSHVLRGEIDMLDGSEKLEPCLYDCGVQDIELEQERFVMSDWIKRKDLQGRLKTNNVGINRVSLDVFVYKGEYPDGRLQWKIKAYVQANDFGMFHIRKKGVSREDAGAVENLLKAELWVVLHTYVGERYTPEELSAFEKLLTWEVCVELLKHEARCLTGKEKRSFDPMLHVGIKGFLFEMKKIESFVEGGNGAVEVRESESPDDGQVAAGDEEFMEAGESENVDGALSLHTEDADTSGCIEVDGGDDGEPGRSVDEGAEIPDSQESETESSGDDLQDYADYKG